jgi:hypothetical protein
MIRVTRVVAWAWAAVMLCSPAFASNVITLQQGLDGYTGCTDAWLDESLTRDNYGGAPNLRIQWNNGRSDCVVLKFDLTGQIPQGSAILAASLSLWYYDSGGMTNENAITIKPFRLQSSAWWDENIYDGVNGYGVSYRYRDAGETYEWTGGAVGGWWDKIDDGNGTNKIKKAGGTPPDAIPHPNWVSFNVKPSVLQWRGGATNNGFLLVATGWEGGGSLGYGLFISRNDGGASYRPKLTITLEPPVSSAKTSWGRIKGLYR